MLHESTSPPGSFVARTAALSAALAAIAVGLACASLATERQTPDDELIVLVPDEIRNLDPRFAITNYDTKVSRLVAPGLMTIDQPSLEPEPALAESIEEVDEVTWDVVLREDARFSDGSPVRAEDVAYTIESTLDPDTGSLYRQGFLDRFESVEVLGPQRARLHLAQPIATLFSDLDFGIVKEPDSRAEIPPLPTEPSAAALAAWMQAYLDVARVSPAARGPVIGAGPYRVVEHRRDRVLLEKNPYYHGEPGRMEQIELRTVEDANARTLMLVGGSADLTQNTVRMDLVSQVERQDRLELQTGPGAVLSFLIMHNDHEALSDVRVRRAIAHAIDRERIIDAKYDGRAERATGLMPSEHWAYNGDVERYDYDPGRAAELLDEAGFPDPGDGSPRLSLRYRTSANPFQVAVSRIIASQLGEVGIDVDVRAFEFHTFLEDVKQGSFDLASMGTAPITEPDYSYEYFHSARIPDEDDPDSNNRSRYRNERVDELAEAGRQEMDRDRRIEIYAEMQEILARDVPVVPLWHADNVVVRNVDVKGYELLPTARFHGLASAEKAR